MKKIAIITLNGNFNYGNRLQNYALNKIITDLGFEAETVFFENKNTNANSSFYQKIKGRNVIYIVRLVLQKYIINAHNQRKLATRRLHFDEFTKKYIRTVKIDLDVFDNQDEYFYAGIVGSDQVWNPYYIKGNQNYFLKFINSEKRYSYAASFGINEIPNSELEFYRSNLSEMKSISVREESASQLLKELFNIDSEVHVDPTLLLSKEEWIKIEKKPSFAPAEPYVLTYFLGARDLSNNINIKNYIEEKKYRIINLNDYRMKRFYNSDPSEFLYLIRNCELFLTDSFHGCVFSIIFKKKFVVYNRIGEKPMFSRIDNILNLFDLTNRKNQSITSIESIDDISYTNVDEVLIREKTRALAYLAQINDDING